MIFVIISIAILAIVSIAILVDRFTKIKIKTILKVMAIALILVFIFRLVGSRIGYFDIDGTKLTNLGGNEYFDNVFNLFLTDIHSEVNSELTWLNQSRALSMLLVFTRWGTMSILVFAVLAPFYKQRQTNQLIVYFGIPIVILNIVFFTANIQAIQFNTYLGFRYFQYAIETIIFSSIILVFLYQEIFCRLKEKKRFDYKEILIVIGTFLLTSFVLMPQSTLSNLFGNVGSPNKNGVFDVVAKGFNPYHLILIFIPFLIIIVTFLMLRKKDRDLINFILMYFSLGAVIQYFYVTRSLPGGLPLHLCNAAVIMILVSMIFNHRGSFYFSFFANVLGAFLAIVLPNYATNPFSMLTMHFTYNHTFAVVIPVLGVALKKFGRPKIKDMYQTIMIFSFYFFVTVVINTWLNADLTSYDSLKADYFFSYSNFLTDFFSLTKLKNQLSIAFVISGKTYTVYYFFQLLYFVVFVGLMFVTWLIYDLFFKTSDQHQDMKNKLYEQKMDILKLKELMRTRALSEPLSPKGGNMIKIKNFSKKYGKSNRLSVDDFTLTINAGEVFGFLGHNGAGKSTTIKSLVGIQSITEGEMEICGYSIKSQPLEAKLNIGYVSDNHAVYERLTGREYINYVADLYLVSLDDRNQRLEEYLDKFALRDAIDYQIKGYSHGMKQKLVVISSLIHNPKVWVLDEPLTGLDPTSAFQIKETMIEHAKKGNVVFFSSHVIEVVEKICDRIAIIGHGKLEGIYIISDLKKQKISLEELYIQSVNKNKAVNHLDENNEES